MAKCAAVILFHSLVIKWRFVSRVEDQMKKFMEASPCFVFAIAEIDKSDKRHWSLRYCCKQYTSVIKN